MKPIHVLPALLLLAACGSADPAPVPDATPDDTGIIDESALQNETLSVSYAPITGVGGHNANGVITLRFMESGQNVLDAQLNIDLPPAGALYAGWIGKDESWTPVGTFTNPFGDVRHVLRYVGTEQLDPDARFIVTILRQGETERGEPVAVADLQQSGQ